MITSTSTYLWELHRAREEGRRQRTAREVHRGSSRIYFGLAAQRDGRCWSGCWRSGGTSAAEAAFLEPTWVHWPQPSAAVRGSGGGLMGGRAGGLMSLVNSGSESRRCSWHLRNGPSWWRPESSCGASTASAGSSWLGSALRSVGLVLSVVWLTPWSPAQPGSASAPWESPCCRFMGARLNAEQRTPKVHRRRGREAAGLARRTAGLSAADAEKTRA